MCKSSKVDSKAFCWRGYQTSENFFQALPNSRRSWVVELVIFCLDSARLHYRPSFFAGTGSLHGLAWQQWRRRRWFKKYQTETNFFCVTATSVIRFATFWHFGIIFLKLWTNFERVYLAFGKVLNLLWPFLCFSLS